MIEEARLPSGWSLVSLADLGDWCGGGTPSKSNSSFWSGGTIPWVSPKDMKVEELHSSQDLVTEAAVAGSAAKLIGPGAVLVVTRSGILAHTFPVATTAVAVTVNQDLKALQPADGVSARYVASALRSFGSDVLRQCSKDGVTVQSVDTSRLLAFRIPLAPRHEQGRVAAAIDSYTTRLDDAVAGLKRVQRNLERYRASVLQAAVEGRLVPTEAELARAEGRDYEPASALLERILKERRRRWEEAELAKLEAKGQTPKNDKWKAKYKEPAAPATESLPTLPTGWVWSTVDALAEVVGGLTKGKKRKATDELREVPYLRVANVQRGYLDLGVVKTIRATPDEIEALRLRDGDVLLNEGGDRDKLGRGWVWSGELPVCIHQNHVFRARLLTTDVLPKYLSWYANTSGQQYFFDEGRQTTNLASINKTKLKGLPVPVPPLAEQGRIALEVERLDSVAAEAQLEVEHSLRRCARLRQSILKWAFEGKLVDQDPNDEPAEALLARIHAEREAHAASKPKKAPRTRRK